MSPSVSEFLGPVPTSHRPAQIAQGPKRTGTAFDWGQREENSPRGQPAWHSLFTFDRKVRPSSKLKAAQRLSPWGDGDYATRTRG